MSSLFAPVVWIFMAIILGVWIGKIKIGFVSLDLAGILVVAAIVGYWISVGFPHVWSSDFQWSMNFLSKLGSALFVSAIGLSAADSVVERGKASAFFSFLFGAMMVGSGIVTMKLIGYIDPDIEPSLLLGILCGALTSTPGLTSVCDTDGVVPELAVIGYGCSYLFGVIGVVLFVQLILKKRNGKAENSPKHKNVVEVHQTETLIPIGLSIVLGSIVGEWKAPFFDLSLGTAGGILCVAMMIGLLSRKHGPRLHDTTMSCYRTLGLSMFFVGSGMSAGTKLYTVFQLKWFIYGAIMTVVPILIGYAVCRIGFKKSREESACMIAGGMTSTPAMGILIRNSHSNPDMATYSIAYLGALLTMVVFGGQ